VVSQALMVSGPGAPNGVILPLDGAGRATYTPYQPGTYTLTAIAQDRSGNQGTGTASFIAQGTPDTTPPVVSLQIAPRTVAIGGSVTLAVTASDNVGVTATALEINGTPVTLDGAGRAVFTPPVIGTYTAVARARDATENETSVTQTFRVVDPAADTTPPTV